MSDPNSFDKEIKDAQGGANPATPPQGTVPEPTGTKPNPEAGQDIDYKTKFAESSKEALRLLDENKKLAAELAAKGNPPAPQGGAAATESLYPGFEELDPEAQKNLISYTDAITKRTREEIYKDPAISFAVRNYNENKFDKAFESIVAKFPELKNSKDEFKTKYFNPSNTPDNIETILGDIAKIYLFDKAKEIGAKEEQDRAGRIDMERASGGDKTPQPSRSLDDWRRMAQENPVKFASLSKEYNADLAAGKLKE
jgi:hypothetical protein